MAFIISVLHNFVNIFMYILCSFAYFTQSPASSIVHLLYQNDTFSTYIVSFVYCFCLDFVHPGHTPSPALSPLLLPAAVLFCSKIPFPPQGGPRRAASCCGTYFPAARKQRGPSGAPAVCRIHILFTYRSDPGIQAPGPGILQARSPLALDHDTDDLFIGLFHSVLGETAHVLDGVLHTLLYDAIAAVELLAFDVHIIA